MNGLRTVRHNLDGTITITDTRTLDEAQEEARNRLALHFDTIVAAGRNYQGKNFQIDGASLQNINGASSMAMIAQANAAPYSQGWIASDNSVVTFDAAGMIAFGVDVGAYYSALVLNNRALKDAIAALADNAACDSFDVTQGWPSN